jgi:hypothetical protein
MRTRRLWIFLLAALALALSAANAFAAEEKNHKFEKPLITGFVDPDAKQPVPILNSPCGVAVNLTGKVFVADYKRHSIYTPTDPAVNLPANANAPCALAADPFNLYGVYWHGAVLNTATEAIDPRPATGVAVAAESFDLYVNHRTSVDVYAAPISPGDPPVMEIGNGALEDAYGVAVSNFAGSPGFAPTAGYVYVGDAADNTVKVFNPSTSLTTPIDVIEGTSTAAGEFVSLRDTTLALDQSNGHLFVVDNLQPGFEHPRAAISEFNAAGIYRDELDYEFIHGEPTGITVNESLTPANGDVYVTSGNGTSLALTPPSGIPVDETGELLDFGPAGKGKKLSATVSGTGSGTVTSNPAGINCPDACEAELNEGATIEMIATPDPGSAFGGWSGACTGTGTCSIPLNAPATVDAEFVPAPTVKAVASKASSSAANGVSPGVAAGASLRVGKVSSRRGTAILRVSVPGPGTIAATGNGVSRQSTFVSNAGSTNLRVRLSPSGRRALAQSKANRLALRLVFSFRPSDGGAGIAGSKIVTFK